MKEQDIELECKNLAIGLGWWWGKGTGRNGIADKLYMKDGRGFVVEKKKPGKPLSADQVIEQNYCEQRGVPYYRCESLLEFRDILLTEEAKL